MFGHMLPIHDGKSASSFYELWICHLSYQISSALQFRTRNNIFYCPVEVPSTDENKRGYNNRVKKNFRKMQKLLEGVVAFVCQNKYPFFSKVSFHFLH